jgi:hypothetical protein
MGLSLSKIQSEGMSKGRADQPPSRAADRLERMCTHTHALTRLSLLLYSHRPGIGAKGSVRGGWLYEKQARRAPKKRSEGEVRGEVRRGGKWVSFSFPGSARTRTQAQDPGTSYRQPGRIQEVRLFARIPASGPGLACSRFSYCTVRKYLPTLATVHYDVLR